MCGRYSLDTPGRIADRFGASGEMIFPSSWNITPGMYIPTITNNPSQISYMRWGLVPEWLKEKKGFTGFINARAESVFDKPSFSSSAKNFRCIFPASGFFEWKKGNGKKIPWYFKLKSGGLFGFAGIYNNTHDAEGKNIQTAAIITTTANSLIAPIHPRMPVILKRSREKGWLRDNNFKSLEKMLEPYSTKKMQGFEVTSLVNNIKNDGVELIKPKTV